MPVSPAGAVSQDSTWDALAWQMINLREAIRVELDRERRRQELLQVGRELRLAWTFGKTTLYKYMSLADQERRNRVLDVLRNSRVYLSAPSQLNDAADCRPRFELAKPLSDPDFVRELQADEERMIVEQRLTPDEVERLHAQYGVEPERLAEGVTEHTRRELESKTRIYCLSARNTDSGMWGLYAGLNGVCLHFACHSGSVFGNARGVVYLPTREPILIPIQYNSPNEIADRMAFVKGERWQGEEEYRLVAFDGSLGEDMPLIDDHFVAFAPERLTGITLGMNIDPGHRALLLDAIAARSTPAEVFEAVEGDGH
jgi:hypothetical protein